MKRNLNLKLAVPLFVMLLFFGCRGWLWPHMPFFFPTIHNIWPNVDGTSWTYDYTWRIFHDYEPPRLHDTSGEVPPVPGLDELAEYMDEHPVGGNPDVTEMIYELQFDGMITTQSGVTAQNLEENLYLLDTHEPVGEEAGAVEAFYARLIAARPDLRQAINDRLAAAGAEGFTLSGTPFDLGATGPRSAAQLLRSDFGQALSKPILIHGYAWERTSDWIGTYGDLDQLLAYKFLEANLLPGHEFTHQLVPSLADDIFLHCRVLRRFFYRSALGHHRYAVECLYAIDYGIATVDGTGGNKGYYRLFDYGTVIYAPSKGPVYCYERNLVQPGEPLSIGVGDKIVTIVGANWGAPLSGTGEEPPQ